MKNESGIVQTIEVKPGKQEWIFIGIIIVVVIAMYIRPVFLSYCPNIPRILTEEEILKKEIK